MKKRALVLLLALTMVLSLFAACSGGGNAGSAAPSTDGGSASGEAAPSTDGSAPSAGANDDDVLKIRMYTSLVSTDCDQVVAVADYQVIWHNVFEGLYGVNEAAGGYYNELAKEVAISDDQLTYTVTLEDATFQNGDKMTSDDVVYSYERAMKNTRWDYLTNMIETVTAKEENVVEFKLKYPYSPIGHTFFCIKIVNKNVIEEQGDAFGTQPHQAATGPYYISGYDPASGVTMKAYDGYRKGVANVKNVEFVVISEDSAAVIAYMNGDIDYLHDAPTAEWERIESSDAGQTAMLKGNSVRTLCINWFSPTNNNILGNEKVRQAIYYAVNKEMVNMVATNGYGTVAREYMPPEYVPTSPKAADGGFETYEYDPEKAKALLKEAGFTDDQLAAGVDIGTITTYGNATSEKAKQCQVVQANLAEVGLKCEIHVADVAVISPQLHEYDYDLCVYGDSGNYDYNNIRQQVHSESVGRDVVRYRTEDMGIDCPFDGKRIEELLDLAVGTSDPAERIGYYTELWSIVSDTATILPMIHMPVGIAWSNRMTLNDLNPTYYHVYDFSWA